MPNRDYPQDLRVWCLESLIKMESCLHSDMYQVADMYLGSYTTKNPEALYTLWMGWKLKRPSKNTNPL